MDIKTGADFRKAIKQGAYAWPGGYPIYFIVDDGEALSFKDAKDNAKQIISAIRSKDRGGWRVVASDINWEDENLYSAHSGDKIESAYGENPKKRTRPRANTPEIHIDVNSHNQREAGAYMKNPAPKKSSFMQLPKLKPGYVWMDVSPLGSGAPQWEMQPSPHYSTKGKLFGYDEKEFMTRQYKKNPARKQTQREKKYYQVVSLDNLNTPNVISSFPFSPQGKKNAVVYANAFFKSRANKYQRIAVIKSK